MANAVALCMGFCGVVLFTFLLTERNIGSKAYAGLVVVTIFAAIVVAKIDLLESLDLKNLRSTFREIEKAKGEVYAKAEEVKRVAEGVGAFAVANVISEGRFSESATHAERMLSRRDELSRFLKDSGIPDDRREALVQPITLMADWDMRYEILINARAAWKPPPGTDPTDASKRDEIERDLRAILQNPDRRAAVQRAASFLEAHHVASDALTQSIAGYRRLLDSGRLPPTGPADDIRRAPTVP